MHFLKFSQYDLCCHPYFSSPNTILFFSCSIKSLPQIYGYVLGIPVNCAKFVQKYDFLLMGQNFILSVFYTICEYVKHRFANAFKVAIQGKL